MADEDAGFKEGLDLRSSFFERDGWMSVGWAERGCGGWGGTVWVVEDVGGTDS